MCQLIAITIALLAMVLPAVAQDQFNVNTNPASANSTSASCMTAYEAEIEKLREQEAQAQGQFRKDIVDCNHDTSCINAAIKKGEPVEIEIQKGQIDAEATRQICDNHVHLAEAIAFNAKNNPDPCQAQYDQTLGGLSDQNILAEAQIRKGSVDCRDPSYSGDSGVCEAAIQKRFTPVLQKITNGQTDASTNKTICEDRIELAQSESRSSANGEPPAAAEAPNVGPTTSTRLSGGVSENAPPPGATASTGNNSGSTATPAKGTPEVPTLAPVAGPVVMRPLQGKISKNAVRNPPHPPGQSPASAILVKNQARGHVSSNSVTGQSGTTQRTGNADSTRQFDPRRPEMGALVPRNFPPNRLPEGIYVVKGRDGRGYAMPIEGCLPDSGTDLALANLGAVALKAALRACTAGLGIATGPPLPSISHVPSQDEMVWVNTTRGIIWRQGTKWAGSTSRGFWTTLNDAIANGYRLPKPNPTGLPW
ncbi:MAG: hypothetical protein IVW56_07205 [Candidatus Binataceae bacterium]|nr:hypothetical protein [Candidatus Binataceae bacterium]